MKYPWVNTLLSGFVPLALVSGFFGMTNGSPEKAWIVWLHAAVGWAIAVLIIWKSSAVFRSYQRRPKQVTAQRSLFISLALLLVVALATGFASAFAGHLVVRGYPFMTLHVLAALLLLPLFALHIASMRFVFRVSESRDRRAFLRLAGAGAAGIAVWQLSLFSQRVFDLPGASRRFTGSTETGSFSGRFPFVTWLFDRQDPIDGTTWRLQVDGAVDRPFETGLDELAALTAADERIALIDCTGGWYSEQRWGGVPVGQLLDRAGVHAGASQCDLRLHDRIQPSLLDERSARRSARALSCRRRVG